MYLIDVRKIRRYHDIKSSNRSKINFIYRNLMILADYGIIKRYRTKHAIKYGLPKEKILIKYKAGKIDEIMISTFSHEKKEKIYFQKSNHII